MCHYLSRVSKYFKLSTKIFIKIPLILMKHFKDNLTALWHCWTHTHTQTSRNQAADTNPNPIPCTNPNRNTLQTTYRVFQIFFCFSFARWNLKSLRKPSIKNHSYLFRVIWFHRDIVFRGLLLFNLQVTNVMRSPFQYKSVLPRHGLLDNF